MSNIFPQLKEMVIQALIREELDDLGFTEAKENLEEVKNFFETLENLDADRFLPKEKLEDIKNLYNDTLMPIREELSNFVPKQHEQPYNKRQELLDRIGKLIRSIFDHHSILPYLFLKNRKLEKAANRIEDQKVKIVENAKIIKNQADQSLKNLEESKQALESTKEMTGKAVSLYYSDVFSQQAINHEKAAEKWLRYGVSISGGFLLTILIIFFCLALAGKIKFDDWYNMMPVLISKGLIISVLYLGLHQCIKNYKTHRHLYILNKHRDNALQTFKAFVNASSGEQDVKDTLLTIAAKSIYNINKTGYLSKDEQGKYSFTLNDIVRQITTNN